MVPVPEAQEQGGSWVCFFRPEFCPPQLLSNSNCPPWISFVFTGNPEWIMLRNSVYFWLESPLLNIHFPLIWPFAVRETPRPQPRPSTYFTLMTVSSASSGPSLLLSFTMSKKPWLAHEAWIYYNTLWSSPILHEEVCLEKLSKLLQVTQLGSGKIKLSDSQSECPHPLMATSNIQLWGAY